MPLPNLFNAKRESTGISDEHRMLMDDLKISPDSVNLFRFLSKTRCVDESVLIIRHFYLVCFSLSRVQDHAAANVFTGQEEVFAFQRTISRLAEMQSKDYWELWNKKMV